MIEKTIDLKPEKNKEASEVSKREKVEVNELPDRIGEELESDNLPDFIGEYESFSEEGHSENNDTENNSQNDRKETEKVKDIKELPERMKQICIYFKCPEGIDRNEFIRQLKAQERGLNRQSVAENMENRKNYQERKEASETGNGRAKEASEAQRITREKAYHSRLASNIKAGMSYIEAKASADAWIKTQAALHNPDQIAGGNPVKVSRMGDAKVNSSIGSQWKSRVGQLESATKEFAKNYSVDELSQIKMNVRLEVE